jgi:PAS domain-containing protein
MDLDLFAEQIEAAQRRVSELHAKSSDMSVHRLALQLAFAELDTRLEELRTAEEELHAKNQEFLATRQAVEAERQRYRLLFEEAPDAYLVTTLSGTIEAANQAAAQLLNIDPQFLVGLPLTMFLPQEERHRFYKELIQLQQ